VGLSVKLTPCNSLPTHVSAENARAWGTVGCFALPALDLSSPITCENHLYDLLIAHSSRLAARGFAGASTIVTLEDIQQAHARLNGITVHTPAIDVTAEIADPGDTRRLFLKLENLQPIGAFKLRGAYNKIASLTPEERKRGVIAYSSGNHAQGVAYAARALNTKAVIVMPGNAPPIKLKATAGMGAEIVKVGAGSQERQLKAEELAAQHGYAIVPPYNDEKIIAGQGTMGLEILEQVPDVETVLVPVGGGGMISGVAAAIKLSRPSVKVVGVEPALAADAQASFRSGKVVNLAAEEVTRTMADGLRTQSIGAINFEHIRKFVDDIVTVSEEEIREATRRLSMNPRTVAEPSGAVSVAGFLFHGKELPAATVHVAVISGGNIEPAILEQLRM
jgi:threonine dehydratase